MTMDQAYELECMECGEFTTVVLEYETESYPTHCPLCGGEAEAELVELKLQ